MARQTTRSGSGSGNVEGAATGRPEAQTHLASMAGTHASGAAHRRLAEDCRRIAAFYGNSGDRHLAGLQSLWLSRAAHAEQVAQNRAMLTAGHSAAASDAANRG